MPIFSLLRKKKANSTFPAIKKIPSQAMQEYLITEAGLRNIKAPDLKALIQNIQDKIRAYNELTDEAQKSTALKEMQAIFQTYESLFPPSEYVTDNDYLNFQSFMFNQIKEQYASMGLSPAPNPESASPLAIILASMSTRVTEEFLKILDSSNNLSSDLKKLYPPEDKSEEAVLFRHFLKNHEISYLGGNNSKNFKIRSLESGQVEVLKIENRLDTPKAAELYLRQQGTLQHLFTPITAERLTRKKIHFGPTVTSEGRALQITEYCSGGCLLGDSQDLNERKDPIKHSAQIFEQMAQAFIDISQAGCFFPDAKLANWLVDENNKLRLADTKSLIFANNGQCSDRHFLSTPAYRPEELYKIPFQTEPVHSYLLGLNLYLYVTQQDPHDLYEPLGHEGRAFDFNYPIFDTNQGQRFKFLIESLVQSKPGNRMSVETAQKHLKYMNLSSELDQFVFGETDKEMKDYLQQKKSAFDLAKTPEEKQKVLDEMSQTLAALKNNPLLVELKKIAQHLHEESNILSFGMDKKAKRIENELSKLTLEARCNSQETDQFKPAIKQLASHRTALKSGKIYEIDGKIDEAKAAQSFKDFKKKFQNVSQDLTHEAEATEKIQETTTPSFKS